MSDFALDDLPSLDISIFEDVIENGCASRREELARQLCRLITDQDTPANERKLAWPAVIKLACDPEKQVRGIVAAGLQDEARVDADLVFTIAAADDDIALPFLAVSPSLDEAGMLAILKIGDEGRQCAIAARADISAKPVRQIIHNGCAEAVRTLLLNPAVRIGGGYARKVYNRFHSVVRVTCVLLDMPGCPGEIQVVHTRRLTNDIRNAAQAKGWYGDNDSEDFIIENEERTMLSILDAASDGEIRTLIPFMAERELFSTSLLLRSGVSGNIRVFEYALAYLSGMSMRRIRKLTAGESAIRLASAIRSSGVSPAFHDLLKAIFEVSAATGASGKAISADTFGRALVEAVMTRHAAANTQERRRLINLIDRLSEGRTKELAQTVHQECRLAA